MDGLPSAAFRKQYAKLTEPTRVTVNGHVIGLWIPNGGEPFVYPDQQTLVGMVPREPGASTEIHGFNTRPFTPVPKPGQK